MEHVVGVELSETSNHEEENELETRSNNSGSWDWNWDGLRNVVTNNLVFTRNLFLIRHGQYDVGGHDFLTPLGEEQCRMVGRRLHHMNYPYKCIYVSTMQRAWESAVCIAEQLRGVPLIKCHLLCEGAPCRNEPPFPNYQPTAQELHNDSIRIEQAFKKYFYRPGPEQTKNSYEIIVCHANVIRYFLCRALQLPITAWGRFSINNASLSWIALRGDGRNTMIACGDVGFMPCNKITIT